MKYADRVFRRSEIGYEELMRYNEYSNGNITEAYIVYTTECSTENKP